MQLNWDLTHLYKNEEEWNKDYKKIEENLKELNTNIKKILYNKEEFKKYLELKIETERIIDRVFSYSKKKVHLNMTLENYKEQMKNVLSLYGKFQVISNEFEKLCIENENKIQEYLKDRELKKYQRHIKLILRKKEHTITSKENLELLANYEKELQDIRNKYQETIMKIGQIEITYNGETITINKNNINELLLDNNQEKRKVIYEAYMKQHEEISEIVSELYKNKLKIEIKLSRLKNYKSLIEESMDEYEIEKTFFNMVIEEISKKSEVKQKYNKLKKEALSLNQFNNYDTLLSICDIPKINIEIEEGIKAIKKALAILGETYTKLIDEMFENGWAHAYPQENKIGGSHSSIAYDGVPYILVNYTGTITSLRLLAHEIGHAVNTHYSKQENGYLDFSVTYFLTEVASKVNEILLNKSLIENATNGEEKIYILNDNINAIINSIFNQAMISEFENEIIKQIENQQEIESEEINKIYLKLVEKYNGEQLTINEKMKYEWIKISHLIMQNSYYVYQYSVGACLSIYIVKKLLKDKEFKEKYIKFLSLGNSKSIEEILSTLDIDIANYNFIDYGIEYVNELLEELQKLLKEKEQKRIKSLII